jgi:hypothetical protein
MLKESISNNNNNNKYNIKNKYNKSINLDLLILLEIIKNLIMNNKIDKFLNWYTKIEIIKII